MSLVQVKGEVLLVVLPLLQYWQSGGRIWYAHHPADCWLCSGMDDSLQ